MRVSMMSQLRYLLLCCSLMLLPIASSFAENNSADEKQKKVDKLLLCLGGLLSVPGEDSTTTGCVEVGTYDASDPASYAMGVSLQKKLLAKHATFDLVDFINGLLDAKSSSVKMSDSTIAKLLKNSLLNDAEASQQYLEDFSQRDEVFEVSGVFYRNFTYLAEGDGGDAENSKPDSSGMAVVGNTGAFTQGEHCKEVRMTDAFPLQVRFYRVKPIETIFSHDDLVDIPVAEKSAKGIECIAYQANNVIRGWRLFVNKLKAGDKLKVGDKLKMGDLYDVLIPSELAYGATGVQGEVEAGENLRFLMLVENWKVKEEEKKKGTEEKEQQASTDN